MSVQTTTYTLKHPITVDDETYVTITVYEPNVVALEALDDIGIVQDERPRIKHLRQTVAALTRLPNEVIGELHRDDFEGLLHVALPFLEREEAGSVQ